MNISFNRRGDSLGGATAALCAEQHKKIRFNRRGDSLGGATQPRPRPGRVV